MAGSRTIDFRGQIIDRLVTLGIMPENARPVHAAAGLSVYEVAT